MSHCALRGFILEMRLQCESNSDLMVFVLSRSLSVSSQSVQSKQRETFGSCSRLTATL